MRGIELEIPIDDFTREAYRFYFNDSKGMLLLDFYAKYTRQTKRHGWNADEWYSRLDERGSGLKENEVPFDNTIKKMALDKFMSSISIKKQSEI